MANLGQIPSIVLLLLFIEIVHSDNIGTFWQFTDVHYDSNYSDQHTSLLKCHRQPQDGSTRGVYGDYDCDSPWTLVVSAINAMKLIEPNPDFVLWTGDSVPHVPDSILSPPKVFSLIKNVTSKLKEIFHEVPIFPLLGNHDSWPSNQVPGVPTGYYDNILHSCGWESLLDRESVETFRKGGFYSIKTPSGHTLLVINTVLYYSEDNNWTNQTDPALQLMWLEQQLTIARNRGQKVYIASHVPPGMMARAPMAWFRPEFNDKFLNLLQKYSNCILATIFGHEHTDSFRIVYDKGVPTVPMFLAPAVTPWKSSIPGIGANNPSVRLYHYDKGTGFITDYLQYYLNISAANTAGKADWLLEYQATGAFGLKNVGAPELGILVDKFKDKYSDAFNKYFTYNSVSYDTTTKCAGDCKIRHVCAITNISYTAYNRCVETRGTFGVSSHFPADMMNHHSKLDPDTPINRGDTTPMFLYFVISAVIPLISVMLLAITILVCRRRHVSAYFGQPHYMPINA